MSTRQDGARAEPISSRDELVAWFEAGCKPPSDFRIGTEHEKFGFRSRDLSPVPYDGPQGIRALLERLIDRFGWQPIREGEAIIALQRPGEGTVSLEPGGQLELSGAPLATLHDTAAETRRHLDEVRAVGDELGLGFLGLGFSPLWSRSETPRMPKGRYDIMTRYMPRVGKLGLDMMYRSATVQVNLDFSSEADMVRKLRVSLALQPVAAALAANSPFTEGRRNGYKTFRSAVWLDTDAGRTGMLPFAFEPGMGFERYVDYVLDVPMYFVFRDRRYIDVAGSSFRDFLAGKLDALPGERPDIADWADHVSTAFPEVRMKRFLEMRGADGGGERRIIEVPAFWVGLLYDDGALDAAAALVADWTEAERQAIRQAVPKLALAAPFRRGTVGTIARQAVAIAREGLRRRARIDSAGRDEGHYLDHLEGIAATGRTEADRLIERFDGPWRGDVRKVFDEAAI